MDQSTLPRLNLHELLMNTAYDHAVICTYTFDPEFFEGYCLEKFNSLKNNANISVIVDYGTYQSAISGPVSYRPRQANIRYFFYPISVPGCFHAKLFLLASRNKGRLIIGSANFTRQGITHNAEMVNYYDFETEKNERFKYLFQDAFMLLNDLSRKWPSSTLLSNLKCLSRDAAWIVSEQDNFEDSSVALLHNLEASLWEQIVTKVEPPVDTVYVLSRYFDLHPSILDRVTADLQPGRIRIYTQNNITTLTKDWLQHSTFKDKRLEIFCCSYMDEDLVQPLHAKAIAVETKNQCLLGFGSANFTSPALMNRAEKSNMEVFILLSGLAKQAIIPSKLFDPHGNAHKLNNSTELHSAPRQVKDTEIQHRDIELYESSLIDQRICIRAKVSEELSYDKLFARVIFQDDAYQQLLVRHDHDQEYYADSSKDITHRLNETSSVMIIQAYDGSKLVCESNPILVTNLIDIKTGKIVRRERHIKEAQQSAVEFFKVLSDLLKEGEEEPLIVFFNYCDIPIMDAARPIFYRGVRPEWDSGRGMRSLGEKNLKIFSTLHEAAIHFYDRHFNKLQRHVKGGGIRGVANFLHIFLAMGGVLRAQVERAMLGFEAKSAPLSSDDWYKYRTSIDLYFRKFKELMICLHDQYLPNLIKKYKLEEIRERFAPDLQPLRDLCNDMLSFRYRMEKLVKSKLKIVNPNGQVLNPKFFKDNVFQLENWCTFEAELTKKLSSITNKLAA